MEKILHYQQNEVIKHEKYFADMANSHKVMLITTLLPAFLWGWKKGQEKGVGVMLKQLARVVLMTAFSKASRHFIHKHIVS